MLKKETIKLIATLAKVKESDLEAAIKSADEVDFKIDETLTPFSEDELKVLKDNEYKNGKKAGLEMEIKDLKEKRGLDFQGKNLEGLLDAQAKKTLEEAKIEPDKKVVELEAKIGVLTKTVQEYDTKIAEKDSEVSTIKVNSELYKYIPPPGESGPAFTQDEIIGTMKINGYEFKLEGDKITASKGGKLLVDKLGNPLPVKDVTNAFMLEKKIITAEITPGGRGGEDKKQPAGSFGKLSDIRKSFKDQGKSELGEEFSAAVTEAAKVDGFDMAN